jgi:adenine/guanine/hypoxanthine permease
MNLLRGITMYVENHNQNTNSQSFLEKLFKLSENGTNVKTEIIAAITTFITMAYVIFINPTILRMAGMNATGALGDQAVVFNTINDPIVASVFVATCLSSAIGCFLVGAIANLPFALAPGMGLNAFFTFSVVLTMGYTWEQALAIVFISGVLFTIISVTGVANVITDYLPVNLKFAISCGIGVFIALLGLKSGGIIVSNPERIFSFASFLSPSVLLTIFGFIITSIFMYLKVKGSILIGIIATTLLGIPLGVTKFGENIFSTPTSVGLTLFRFDFESLLSVKGGTLGATLLSLIMVIITITIVNLCNTIGTFVGTATKAGLINEKGQVRNMKKATIACAISVIIGAALGTSTVNAYVESNAGTAVGGKTGLTSFVIGILFVLSLFFSGLVGMVPAEATAPALIIVGGLMLSTLSQVDFNDFTETIPAFVTIAIMPMSYSITNGISAGLVVYLLMKIITGKAKEVNSIVYILVLLFILRFLLLPKE